MMSLPTSTPEIVAQEEIRPTIIDGICLPRDDWSGRYFVKRGDNLTRIARSYGLTLTQLQDANCITNPNLVRVGEELRVPQTSEAPPLPTLADLPDDFRPTLVVFDTPTFTPSAVAFRADQPTIIAGSCTVVRWDVQNVQALFFLDESVPLSGSRQVCPDATTDYILRVLYFDGTETERRLTIIVGNDSP